MIDKKQLAKITSNINKNYSGYLKEFHKRVWRTDLDIYRNRINNIGFTNFEKVLDAGCGFGQWALCFSENCINVYAIDSDSKKIEDLKQICNLLQIYNINAGVNNIVSTNFEDSYFDAIYCYSVIYLTNYKKSLDEFGRILKPGGKLYLCTNGLGWYLHNLIGDINSSLPNTRQMAIDTIHNTLDFLSGIIYDSSKQLITTSVNIIQYLKNIGFSINFYGGEGTYTKNPEMTIYSFFNSSYYNEEGVYEIIATKR